ncbi:MAG TPA: membrane protein insertase YidC [Gemmatimonadaceae bacterium]|nr:membrane protein insertase YidC [Gemmatimonadaceae bacterium]
MEKRYFVALLLAAAVVALTQILFPVPRPTPGSVKKSTQITSDSAPTPAKAVEKTIALPAQALQPRLDSAVHPATPEQITTLTTALSTYRFSNIGAEPLSVSLNNYNNLSSRGGRVELGASGQPLLKYALVINGDTVHLNRTSFQLQQLDTTAATKTLQYATDTLGLHVVIRYQLLPDKYVAKIDGQVTGTAQSLFLLIELPTNLKPAESDTIGDLRNLAFSFKPERENAHIVAFSKLDPGEQQLEPGPLAWAAVKNKYFVLGLLNPAGSSFNEIALKGGPRTSKIATSASATIVKSLKTGTFSLDLYAGPQQSTQLIAMGRDFDHVNPYGWRPLQGVVQPIAALCIQLLLWMHQVLKLSYGWVLVIFGILIRVALWPLNQSAMRSSMKMQELQPKLAEVQKKYKDKPEKQREEIMKVYRDHGASPFTALTGCLPALLPMPVLFALFFVFQNTIEFRGVPFLWLHDISIKDPFYILPILMGISMYVLSAIGLRNAPPNPQAKMMSYMFPVMMTFILANMASGLNLYYTAQNLAAIPQQWLLANERARRKGKT